MIDLMLEEDTFTNCGVNLKVIGVGGAGSNAVNSMITSGDMESVQFIVANTDAQALNLSPAQTKIQLGKKITKGLGAGSNPDIGRRAAEEDLDCIFDLVLTNTDILFLTGGLGGGTGSGSLPVIAHAAKELGVLSVGVVTKPFLFEGKRRQKHAEEALKALEGAVDTLIVVPNQRLLETADPKISMLNAFTLSNDILKQAIKGISDIITRAGHINVDFADVRTIMKDTGMAIMGTGRASGTDRSRQAALRAISSPLLENASIHGARGVLINITGNEDLELQEINDAASMVYDMVSPDANIILGSVIDKSMGNEICVTVIATGLQEKQQNQTIGTASSASITTPPSVVPKMISAIDTQPIHYHNSAQEKPFIQPAPAQQAAAPAQTITSYTAQEVEHVAPAAASLAHHEMEAYDLNDLDTPTFLRKKAEAQAPEAHEAINHSETGQV